MLRIFSSEKLVIVAKWSTLLIATSYLFVYSESINFASLHENIVIQFFIVCMLVSFMNRVFNAYRIVQIAAILEPNNHLSFSASLRILLFSEFVSVVMPTTYSAELVRTLKLSQYNVSLKKASIVILLDRGVGLLFLCFGTFAAFLLSDFKLVSIVGEKNFQVITIVILVSLSLLLVIFYRFRIFVNKVISTLKQFAAMDRDVKIVLVSFMSFGTGVISYYFAFVAASVNISVTLVTFIVFISFIARLLPFSILGVSAGEVALVIVSEKFGVSHELAIVTAIIVILSRYLFAAMGFLVEIYLDGVSVVTSYLKKAAKDI